SYRRRSECDAQARLSTAPRQDFPRAESTGGVLGHGPQTARRPTPRKAGGGRRTAAAGQRARGGRRVEAAARSRAGRPPNPGADQ
ncbi:MAG: hypothetical protein BJ554DRAFT_2028, partial [Olpidium bornovanus]